MINVAPRGLEKVITNPTLSTDGENMTFTEGEYLFILDHQGRKHWFRAQKGMMKMASLGTLDGDRLIALDDGDVIKLAGKVMHVFRPTVSDLMTSVERGAQVITPKDAATIILECDITSCRTVLEIGAGSGALSLALLRAIPEEGVLHTIELREEYAKRAGRNISRAGMQHRWSYTIGDATETTVDIIADAVVMDMPVPWEAMDAVEPMLRRGGMLCAYIPNTNQLESTVNELRRRGYVEVRALENIQRGMDVHAGGVRPSFDTLGHTGYLVFARKAARDEE